MLPTSLYRLWHPIRYLRVLCLQWWSWLTCKLGLILVVQKREQSGSGEVSNWRARAEAPSSAQAGTPVWSQQLPPVSHGLHWLESICRRRVCVICLLLSPVLPAVGPTGLHLDPCPQEGSSSNSFSPEREGRDLNTPGVTDRQHSCLRSRQFWTFQSPREARGSSHRALRRPEMLTCSFCVQVLSLLLTLLLSWEHFLIKSFAHESSSEELTFPSIRPETSDPNASPNPKV